MEIDLTGPQSNAYRLFRPKVDLNLPWGRGSGKSWFMRLLAWLSTSQWDGKPRRELLRELGIEVAPEAQGHIPSGLRGVRIIFLAPTFKQFRAIHGNLIKSEILDWAPGANPNWSDYRIEWPGGSWLQAFPAEMHSSAKARGLRGDIVLVDECDDVASYVYDAVIRPWFSEPWSLKISCTGGTPMRGRFGLLWRRHQAGLDPDRERCHSVLATYRDSPEIVDQEEVEEARKDMPPEIFAREWECDFDAGEGLVYNFDVGFHVRKADPWNTYDEFVVGMDHGWHDPGCLLLGGILGHGSDAILHILSEVYLTHTPAHEWDDYASEWDVVCGKKVAFHVDRSQPARIDDLRTIGIDVHASDSNKNAIKDGLARVADMLFVRETEDMGPAFKPITRRWSRLYVDPSCKNLIREFGMYRRKKDPEGQYREEPEDKWNHGLDSLRYMCLGRFGRLPNYRHETPR